MVVLPAPLVPTMAVTDPRGIEKVPLLQITRSPRLTAAWLNTMAASWTVFFAVFLSPLVFRLPSWAAWGADPVMLTSPWIVVGIGRIPLSV